MAELEHVTDDWINQWLSTRKSVAEKRGYFDVLHDAMDNIVRTDLQEYTDSPSVSARRKLRLVRGIHYLNTVLSIYRRYLDVLKPLIEEVAAIQNRPVRVLELASGYGEMSMYLAQMAHKKGIPVEVTGSDYIEHVVMDAERRASQRGLNLHFRTVNVLSMNGLLDRGQYDIFLIIGSMHHFTPGQLAVMLAQVNKIATPGSFFVGIDIHRSFHMLFLLPVLHLITAIVCFPAILPVVVLPDVFHDAWLSARKAHTLYELEQIARIAAPAATVTTAHVIPGLSALTVRF